MKPILTLLFTLTSLFSESTFINYSAKKQMKETDMANKKNTS